MTTRALAWLLGLYALALVGCAFAVHRWARLVPADGADVVYVASEWRSGERLSREVQQGAALAPRFVHGRTYVLERITHVGALPRAPLPFALALVPGRDGVRADLDGKTAVVTPDDLLRSEAYDHGFSTLDPTFFLGTDRSRVLVQLAEQLQTDPDDVARRARLTRIRVERSVGQPDRALAPLEAPALDDATARESVRAAAHHLARLVDGTGRFRYLVDATTDTTLAGYSLPRHAGATFFLAQAAGRLDDATVRWAALRAAQFLREAMAPCGSARCVANGPVADVGSSALALIAFTEIARSGADGSYGHAIRELAAFLRGQQRADGELMHLFDRDRGAPRDVQLLYFTGEAALGLARAHRVTGDARDLDAAHHALAHAVRRSWSFFGSRYFANEEHWTCQAMAELWDRSPDEEALDFCLRWHAYQGRFQVDPDESAFDADGAYGAGLFVTPRVTATASRAEALGATLDVLAAERAAGRPRSDEPALRRQRDRAVAFLLRRQLRDDRAPTYLYARSAGGAFPGSAVDAILRIDYAQHAGSALVRWLERPGGGAR